jgi:hypothetical protein
LICGGWILKCEITDQESRQYFLHTSELVWSFFRKPRAS